MAGQRQGSTLQSLENALLQLNTSVGALISELEHPSKNEMVDGTGVNVHDTDNVLSCSSEKCCQHQIDQQAAKIRKLTEQSGGAKIFDHREYSSGEVLYTAKWPNGEKYTAVSRAWYKGARGPIMQYLYRLRQAATNDRV